MRGTVHVFLDEPWQKEEKELISILLIVGFRVALWNIWGEGLWWGRNITVWLLNRPKILLMCVTNKNHLISTFHLLAKAQVVSHSKFQFVSNQIKSYQDGRYYQILSSVQAVKAIIKEEICVIKLPVSSFISPLHPYWWPAPV